MATKYYQLFSLLKSAGNKGATVKACAKELEFAEGSVSPYIWSLRKKFGAEIEVIKNGRSVEAYRLLNADVVEANITPNRRSGTKAAKPAKVTKPVKSKPVKTAAAVKPAKSKNAPVEVEDLEVEEISDSELSDIKSQLGLA